MSLNYIGERRLFFHAAEKLIPVIMFLKLMLNIDASGRKKEKENANHGSTLIRLNE